MVCDEKIQISGRRSERDSTATDYRPVALTSILAKCMGSTVRNRCVASMADRMMDPLQFAYKARRCVEDTNLTLVNLIESHLDRSGS